MKTALLCQSCPSIIVFVQIFHRHIFLVIIIIIAVIIEFVMLMITMMMMQKTNMQMMIRLDYCNSDMLELEHELARGRYCLPIDYNNGDVDAEDKL